MDADLHPLFVWSANKYLVQNNLYFACPNDPSYSTDSSSNCWNYELRIPPLLDSFMCLPPTVQRISMNFEATMLKQQWGYVLFLKVWLHVNWLNSAKDTSVFFFTQQGMTSSCWHFLSRYWVCEDLGNGLRNVCWRSLVQSLEMRAPNPS